MKNNVKRIPPMREFYSCLNEMRGLYQNQGFLIAKDLFEEMKKRHDWMMSYKTFTVYFNKELIGKISNVAPINNQNIVAPVAENKSIDEVGKVVAPAQNTKEEFKPDQKLLDLANKIREANKI